MLLLSAIPRVKESGRNRRRRSGPFELESAHKHIAPCAYMRIDNAIKERHVSKGSTFSFMVRIRDLDVDNYFADDIHFSPLRPTDVIRDGLGVSLVVVLALGCAADLPPLAA